MADVKEWLKRARTIDNLVTAKEKEKEKAGKCAEYGREVEREILELRSEKAEISKAINSVGDYVLRTVLIEYYINGKTWEQVAVDMNYSYMQVCRLHGRALQKIKIE